MSSSPTFVIFFYSNEEVILPNEVTKLILEEMNVFGETY